MTVDASHPPVDCFHLHAGIADYFHREGQPFQSFTQPTKMDKISRKLVHWNFEPLEYGPVLTNELRTVVIPSRCLQSNEMTRFWLYPRMQIERPRGLNEVSLPLARMGDF